MSDWNISVLHFFQFLIFISVDFSVLILYQLAFIFPCLLTTNFLTCLFVDFK